MEPDRILQEIQNRNHFVFKKVFQDFYEELVKYAHGYLFDLDSSEDVVQEVFVCLWEKSNQIEIKTSLKAYLYAMVRNRCLNHLKSIKITDNSNAFEFQLISNNVEETFYPFPEEELKPDNYEVLRILDSLPDKMRTIVRLRFVDNYRYAEIAEEMGVSVNTVKTQLKRAKIKFGKLIVVAITLLSILQ